MFHEKLVVDSIYAELLYIANVLILMRRKLDARFLTILVNTLYRENRSLYEYAREK